VIARPGVSRGLTDPWETIAVSFICNSLTGRKAKERETGENKPLGRTKVIKKKTTRDEVGKATNNSSGAQGGRGGRTAAS